MQHTVSKEITMGHSIRNAAVLAALALAVTVSSPAPAAADRDTRLRGVVEQLPDAPDRIGRWRIDGHAVVVDERTRIEERTVRVRPEDGYWTQASTGIVVRAPAWPAVAAHAAGFRPSLAAEVGGIGLGRVVKAKVEPAASGEWRAVEIELGERLERRAAR